MDGKRIRCLENNCLAACVHLTITVSQIKRDIGRKSSFFHTPLAFDAHVRGVPVGISPSRLAQKKLEWLGYPVVKNFEDIFIRFDATHERDGHTDTACWHYTVLMHSIAR